MANQALTTLRTRFEFYGEAKTSSGLPATVQFASLLLIIPIPIPVSRPITVLLLISSACSGMTCIQPMQEQLSITRTLQITWLSSGMTLQRLGPRIYHGHAGYSL